MEMIFNVHGQPFPFLWQSAFTHTPSLGPYDNPLLKSSKDQGEDTKGGRGDGENVDIADILETLDLQRQHLVKTNLPISKSEESGCDEKDNDIPG